MLNFVLDGNLFEGELGVLLIILAVLGGLICLALLFAGIMEIVVAIVYRKYANYESHIGLTTAEITNHFLKKAGLENVQVQKCSFLRLIFVGEGYDPFKKTIFLRKMIHEKKNITGIAVGTHSVGMAILDSQQNKQYRLVSRTMPFLTFAPYSVLPLALVGLLLDLALLKTGFVATFVCLLLGVAFYLFALVVLLCSIPVYKKASKISISLLTEDEVITQSELKMIESLYRANIISSVANFIVAIIYFVRMLLWTLYTLIKIASQIKK